MELFNFVNKERNDRRFKYQQRQTWGLPEPTYLISPGIKGDASHRGSKCIDDFGLPFCVSMTAHRIDSKKTS
jgi:hypothetical protein